MSGPWLAGMLSCCYSFWGLLLLPCIDPVSKSPCHLHLCLDLSFNLSIVFGSFSSGLVFGHSGVTQGFLFRRCLPRSSAAVSVTGTALLKLVTMESRSASSSTSIARGANIPPIVAGKALITVGSFSFSRSNLILGWVGFLELRRVWKVIITMSWLLPTSAPGNVLVLAVLIPERNRFFTKMLSVWLWCVPSGLCHVHLPDGFWLPRVFASTKLL